MNGGNRQERCLFHRAGGGASTALSTGDEQVDGGVKNSSRTLSSFKIAEGRFQSFEIGKRSLARFQMEDILYDSIRGKGRERQGRLRTEGLKTANSGIV